MMVLGNAAKKGVTEKRDVQARSPDEAQRNPGKQLGALRKAADSTTGSRAEG
jgi:hypothetical protein